MLFDFEILLKSSLLAILITSDWKSRLPINDVQIKVSIIKERCNFNPGPFPNIYVMHIIITNSFVKILVSKRIWRKHHFGMSILMYLFLTFQSGLTTIINQILRKQNHNISVKVNKTGPS